MPLVRPYMVCLCLYWIEHCSTCSTPSRCVRYSDKIPMKRTRNCWNNSLWNPLSAKPDKLMSLEFPGINSLQILKSSEKVAFRGGSQRVVLWFMKNYLLQFYHIYLLFDESNPLFLQMCFMRITIAYLCPNMIHFDVVDFSERHSKEVISFFWRSSVYLP